MSKYRYSAKAGQQGGQGGLDVNIFVNQSNTQPVIAIKAFVTQLGKQDVDPILELKIAVYQSVKNGIFSDCDDPHYSVMEDESIALTKAIEQKFQAGEHNPTSLIMLVHQFLVSGIAGAV